MTVSHNWSLKKKKHKVKIEADYKYFRYEYSVFLIQLEQVVVISWKSIYFENIYLNRRQIFSLRNKQRQQQGETLMNKINFMNKD